MAVETRFPVQVDARRFLPFLFAIPALSYKLVPFQLLSRCVLLISSTHTDQSTIDNDFGPFEVWDCSSSTNRIHRGLSSL